jgi:hypothetical protein
MDLNANSKVTRVMNAVAAGTTDQNSTGVDMAGFDSVTFVVLLGTLTATQVTSVKLQQSDVVGSGYTDLEGTDSGNLADDDDDQCVVVTCNRPTKQFVRATILRGTANAVIDGVLAIQTMANAKPTTHDASTVFGGESHSSPDEGTA